MQHLNETAHKILDIAEYFTRQRGFNAFSYKDIQNKLGIKTSSIHYYFPSKQDLALAMIQRLSTDYFAKLASFEAKFPLGDERLKALLFAYQNVLETGEICPFVMLASDTHILRDDVKKQLNQFFIGSESFIERAIQQLHGQEQAALAPKNNSAKQILAAIQGAMLIAKSSRDTTFFTAVSDEILRNL